MTQSLFDPFTLGDIVLKNRIVMAPMTRARAPSTVADDLVALYYRQRAGAGLIITEGTPVSAEGQGFVAVPGIWSDDQVRGWAGVTQGVHEDGGKIFAQLWHVGRMSHVSLQPNGQPPISATATPSRDGMASPFAYRDDGTTGFVPASIPRALETYEIGSVIQDFADAAANAKAAEFDGVELHCANGYLFEQFLNPHVNDRTDRYGAQSLEDRVRFLLETVDAVAARIGAGKVGIRLSPFGQVSDMPAYPEIEETYLHIAQALSSHGLAYIHLMDQGHLGLPSMPADFIVRFRSAYAGTLILAGRLTLARAQTLVDEDVIDLPAFGEFFIANPDLVERFELSLPLATPIRETFYGGGAEGYTDYLPYAAQRASAEMAPN